MAKKYVVELEQDEREYLLKFTSSGKAPARALKRADILLLTDESKSDEEIAAIKHCNVSTVERTRKKFVLEGFPDCLYDKHHPGRTRKLDEKGELILEEIARSKPPSGRKRWTLQLIADRLVTLEVIDSISADTVGRELKKRGLGLG